MSGTYSRWMPVIVVALSAALFILDLFMPLGVANGVLYAGVVLLTWSSSEPRMTLRTALGASILLIAGAFFGPHIDNIPLWVGITNRTLSFVILWTAAVLLYQRQRADTELRQAKMELEHRVRERTRQLADVNQALVEEIAERVETEHSLRASEAELATSRRELQHLAAQLLTAQEQERRRISRDLHDDINQRLAMLVVQVESLETTLPPSAGELGTHLRSIQDRLTELSDDVRHLAYQFHPSILDDLGLVVALRRLVDDFSERSGITGTFDCQSSLRFVPQDVATCLYRVAQECLGNVLKHARAGHVRLSLTAVGGEIELVVEDDGVGFD
ncbi:MAG TPA: sensor histidine kinase, partial [Nitrospiraceae bacterium]|nr:sensor histidine kinase [Nitrospiraceae bacterium]